MKALELFAGIGGISLAAKWAGIETAAFCEIEPFCQRVLQKNFPNVPIFDDVKTLDKKLLQSVGVDHVDLVTGGYPCQPYSSVGKRKGDEDERALWGEMYRLINELNPSWVVAENVTGHINLGLDGVLSDLERSNYETRVFVLPAVSVGAPHKRERVFVVGHSNSKPELQTDSSTSTFGSEWETRESITRKFGRNVSGTYWEENKPSVCGMDDGTSGGLDKSRLIALGNAVVPQQIYPIFKSIATIEGI